MARDVVDATPIGSRDELVAWIAEGEKPAESWRLGTEHEKIPFYADDNRAVPYEGDRGIRALLEGLAERSGWTPILDADHPIGLADETGGGAISLEPGGQFELSGAPVASVHDTVAELSRHLAEAGSVAESLGIRFLTLGASPKWRLDETPVMPKRRYEIMARYMPKVGTRGLDMMFRTATAQVNLDFGSEADMVAKLRASLALQPVAAALFANSPFARAKPNGFVSERADIWLDTDRDRTGPMPFAFEPGMGYERYVDYALDVPMYFVKRGDAYHDVAGASFRDLMDGRLPQMPGERPYLSDWANHLSTIFPDVRLKRFLEMRGADVGPPSMIAALAAFWAGLLYDAASLNGALQLVSDWSAADRDALRTAVAREGLNATVAGRPLRDVARDALKLARSGLQRRARTGEDGRDETHYLEPVEQIAEDGRTLAEHLLAHYEGAWKRSIEPAFAECVFQTA